MIRPTSGRLTIDGLEVVAQPAEVRRRIGVVFQSGCLDRALTIRENLYAQANLYGLRGALMRQRVEDAMERLAIADRQGDLIKTLSGGLRRRAEIARALLHEPRVLLLDEPSTGIDPAARRDVWAYLDQLRRDRGITVLLTSHLMDEAARCDRLAMLHQGKIVATGTPDELKSRIGGDVVVFEVKDRQAAESVLKSRFGLEARVVDGSMRVETAAGHRFLAELIEALPGQVESVALHKPTLEDVFLDETGAVLDE